MCHMENVKKHFLYGIKFFIYKSKGAPLKEIGTLKWVLNPVLKLKRRLLTNHIKETILMRQQNHFADILIFYAETSACQEIIMVIHTKNLKTYSRKT